MGNILSSNLQFLDSYDKNGLILQENHELKKKISSLENNNKKLNNLNENYSNKIEEIEAENVCLVCLDQNSCITFLPCKHRIVCKSCSTQINTCPLCSKNIKNSFETYPVPIKKCSEILKFKLNFASGRIQELTDTVKSKNLKIVELEDSINIKKNKDFLSKKKDFSKNDNVNLFKLPFAILNFTLQFLTIKKKSE